MNALPANPTSEQLDAIARVLHEQGEDLNNGMVGWPRWAVQKYNGSSEPCDMFCGPCSCGAWHRSGR